MSLTRKYLKELGIEAEKIDLIIESHTETVDALKLERDKFRESAERLEKVEKELEKAKENAQTETEWKEKFEKEHSNFEKFRNEQVEKEARENKKNAYKQLLKESGISEKRLETVMKVSNIDSLELDEKGNFKDAEALKESVKKEWADFITTAETKGADTKTPPSNAGQIRYTQEEIARMSQAEINKNWEAIKASL